MKVLTKSQINYDTTEAVNYNIQLYLKQNQDIEDRISQKIEEKFRSSQKLEEKTFMESRLKELELKIDSLKKDNLEKDFELEKLKTIIKTTESMHYSRMIPPPYSLPLSPMINPIMMQNFGILKRPQPQTNSNYAPVHAPNISQKLSPKNIPMNIQDMMLPLQEIPEAESKSPVNYGRSPYHIKNFEQALPRDNSIKFQVILPEDISTYDSKSTPTVNYSNPPTISMNSNKAYTDSKRELGKYSDPNTRNFVLDFSKLDGKNTTREDDIKHPRFQELLVNGVKDNIIETQKLELKNEKLKEMSKGSIENEASKVSGSDINKDSQKESIQNRLIKSNKSAVSTESYIKTNSLLKSNNATHIHKNSVNSPQIQIVGVNNSYNTNESTKIILNMKKEPEILKQNSVSLIKLETTPDKSVINSSLNKQSRYNVDTSIMPLSLLEQNDHIVIPKNAIFTRKTFLEDTYNYSIELKWIINETEKVIKIILLQQALTNEKQKFPIYEEVLNIDSWKKFIVPTIEYKDVLPVTLPLKNIKKFSQFIQYLVFPFIGVIKLDD